MSSDDWWNSTTAAEDAVGALPSNVDLTNASPKEPAETIPLQPRTMSTLSPNNPMPAPPDFAPRTDLQPSSRSPSPFGGHPYPEETAETIPLQPRTRSTLNTNDPKPSPADLTPGTNHPKPTPEDLTPRSNHLHPSRSPTPYGRHPISDLPPFGSNGGHDPFSEHHGAGHENGPEHELGHGAEGGAPIDHDTPEWSTYHHDHTHKKVDRNTFKRNMSIAKGFLDISLLSANSNQLRNLLNFGDRNNQGRFYVTMTALFTSLALQLATGVLLILMERWNINKPHHQQSALRLNNAVTVLVFLTLVINCLVSSMGVDIMQHDLSVQQDHLSRGLRARVNDTLDADLVPFG